jgi:hypothetical protein
MRGKRGQEGGFNWFAVALIAAGIFLVIYLVTNPQMITNLLHSVGLWSSPVNVDQIHLYCTGQCNAPSTYCCTLKSVTFSEKSTAEKITCQDSRLSSGCTVSCEGVCRTLSCKDQGGKFEATACKTGEVEIPEFSDKYTSAPVGDATKTCSAQGGTVTYAATCASTLTKISSSDDSSDTTTPKTCCIDSSNFGKKCCY